MVRAWYMDSSDEDQRLPHMLNPPQFVELEQLNKITGVEYFKINVDDYLKDDTLTKLRKDRGYSYEDQVIVSKEGLPDYEKMIKMFFKEHLHADEEIRLVLDGSGYFDVRDKDDKWIRVEVVRGDMLIVPAGIYHRFTLDEKNYIVAKRYFVGGPVWTPYYRPSDDLPARVNYLKRFS